MQTKAVIKSTNTSNVIRIIENDGMLKGMPCGDSTLTVGVINKHMMSNGIPAHVEVKDIFGRRIDLPVGEVDNVDGNTDIGDLMKLYNAIKMAAGMNDTM